MMGLWLHECWTKIMSRTCEPKFNQQSKMENSQNYGGCGYINIDKLH